MSIRFFNCLMTLLLSGAMLLTACDSGIQDDENQDVVTGQNLPADDEAAAQLSSESIMESLGESASKHSVFGGVVSVMTRNMYVGTDVDAIIAAAAMGGDVPAAVAQAWDLLQQTDFPGRMRAMAREIAQARPHLVGLQEVTTFRAQTPGDAALGGTTPAEDVQMDFLAALLAELESLGQSYRAVAIVQNIDVEMPLIHDPNPATFFSTDIRMTDYDVILARSDVGTANEMGQTYGAFFSIFGNTVDIKRGFVATDATINGRTYRFVSTHLEPVETDGGGLQGYQAMELLGNLAAETNPIILVGDLNTDAYSGGVYNTLVGSDFLDVWDMGHGSWNKGYTCCQDPDLANRVSTLDRRIDYVFVKNLGPTFPRLGRYLTFSRRTGATRWEKTASGLWASDHAGVAAWILVPRR